MRLSPAKKEAITERKNANPISKEQKESNRKLRKKQNKIRIIAELGLKYGKVRKIMTCFHYKFEGGLWKVKNSDICIRKYKTAKAAIRFCKVANTEIIFD